MTTNHSLKDRVAFITGGSRGIGKAIALGLAELGVHITIAAKTDQPHPKLPGTIQTAAAEIEEKGVSALAIKTDIRDEAQVQSAMDACISKFGRLDILVNNASAIFLADTVNTPMKRYDLMQDVNARGTFICSKYAIPHLMKSDRAHILVMCPPLNLNPPWLGNHLAYTLSKYGMSLCVLGLAQELQHTSIAVNGIWPETLIATTAVKNLLGGEAVWQRSRKPSIVADAITALLRDYPENSKGDLLIVENILRAKGVKTFHQYNISSDEEPFPDIFLD